MQENYQNQVQHVGICGRLYSFFITILTARRPAKGLSESYSSNTDDSESEDEFWEAEDSTTTDEGNETDEELVMCARRGAFQKGKEKTNHIEACNGRELELIEELGVYDGTSLSLIHERTYCRSFQKRSPEMVKRRHSMNTQIPKERCEEIGAKPRKGRVLSRVFCNINEKSDAFIRSRKEAMRRSYSVGSKTF